MAEWIVGPADHGEPGDRLGSVWSGGFDRPEYPSDRAAFGRICDEIASDPGSPVSWPFKGFSWLTVGFSFSQYNHTRPPNRPSCVIAPWSAPTAGSRHGGGANVLFLDGRVCFIVEAIDPEVWYALGTRAGKEVVSADALE